MPLIAGKYNLLPSTGIESNRTTIYRAFNTETKEPVIVTIESVATVRHPHLRFQSLLTKLLWDAAASSTLTSKTTKLPNHVIGIPRVLYHGLATTPEKTSTTTTADAKFLEGKYVRVTEVVGKNLETLLRQCGGTFSLQTTLLLGLELLSRIEFVHKNNFVIRDVQPKTFSMGAPSSNKESSVYITDFWSAKRFKNPRDNYRHIPFAENKSLHGTARYASINDLSGYELSRRDDLESLCYVLIYFLKGFLPWQGLPARSKTEKIEKIFKKKKEVSVEKLCVGLPCEFAEMLYYCKTLDFEEEPNYSYLKNLLRGLFEQKNFQNVFDWNVTFPQQQQQVPISSAASVVSTNTIASSSSAPAASSFSSFATSG